MPAISFIINVMPNFLDFQFDFVTIPTSLVFGLVAVIFIALFFWEAWINLQLRKHPDKLLEEDRFKGEGLLQDAMKKSQDIIAESQHQALGILADSKLQRRKIEEDYASALTGTSNKEQFAIAQIRQQFESYLKSLGQSADQSLAGSEKLIEERINKLFEDFEQNLSTYLTETQQQSTKAITLEMESARALIESYKQQQFKLIDENVVAMLEQTLSLVLVKKLSLKDQMDLVYESLEKAKAEKFLL